jgi:hypothetical protein
MALLTCRETRKCLSAKEQKICRRKQENRKEGELKEEEIMKNAWFFFHCAPFPISIRRC